eukprot:4793866-Karenia_brevis.AAC.1
MLHLFNNNIVMVTLILDISCTAGAPAMKHMHNIHCLQVHIRQAGSEHGHLLHSWSAMFCCSLIHAYKMGARHQVLLRHTRAMISMMTSHI